MTYGQRPDTVTAGSQVSPAGDAAGREARLLRFFEHVARRDPDLLRELARVTDFNLEPRRWSFTLHDLHVFLRQHDAALSDLDYRSFRALLYNSPVNRTVKASGAEIVVDDNRGNTDRSRYALLWHARRPDV